jgi:hypothetical protein
MERRGIIILVHGSCAWHERPLRRGGHGSGIWRFCSVVIHLDEVLACLVVMLTLPQGALFDEPLMK